MMGTCPDQVQGFGQALSFPWFELKQALVQVRLSASQEVGHTHLLWVELERLEPTEAVPQGEGISVWDNNLGEEAHGPEFP